MPEFGVVYMPRSARAAVEVARRAESYPGITRLGICDSPILYHELYPVVTACLLGTERIAVGPNVTNPVTRHWTIHAATLRTLDELAPGRAFLGIGAGDGAVHSIGLAPAGSAALEEAIASIRDSAPRAVEIQVAAGGPRKARVAGRVGDAAILGGGIDPTGIANLRAVAQSEANQDGRPAIWALVNAHLVEDGISISRARAATLPLAVAYARHAFDHSFKDKNVPEQYQEPMRERLQHYAFASHAVPDGHNANGQLLSDVPTIEDYVLDRFALVGTVDSCRERLARFLADSDVDGVWLTVNVPDPLTQVDLVGRMTSGLV